VDLFSLGLSHTLCAFYLKNHFKKTISQVDKNYDYRCSFPPLAFTSFQNLSNTSNAHISNSLLLSLQGIYSTRNLHLGALFPYVTLLRYPFYIFALGYPSFLHFISFFSFSFFLFHIIHVIFIIVSLQALTELPAGSIFGAIYY